MKLTHPMLSRLPAFARLMRIDKPIGTLLLLWPTLWGLWFASNGRPDPVLLLIFCMGTFLMRAAGCVINDYCDRDFDGHVARTHARPLVSGEVRPKEALLLAAGLAATAFLLVLPLNRLTLLLSVPAVFLAGSYPLTKRFLALPQAYLGIAFGFGIPMAFAAQTGSVPAFAWILLLANILWTIAYDTEYAMVDRPDDLKIGIKTSAITFGRFDVIAVMLCFTGFIALMVWLGLQSQRGLIYFISLLIASGLIAQQYSQIMAREPAACFKAFLSNNRVGAVIFMGLVLDYGLSH
ncbi:4-hydroxybenzoate octaprenyltransferase [Iodobacter sp. HSC-16F04]|uniref:4-hydroxybenzoate octaprenyltransferase n=1 Tax=Iodobacter violaceini TaxID=3044271 RepID=A0ABX0KZY0_9NEIS|nr:4-hydroxybenzoate octaprenyltransferase [Iodobacter violacea]NHQ86656.1 4-hydroxybenzoate octaprenyltransferase [Iodobacter violacea]